MAKRTVIKKLQSKKAVQKRWNKWEERRDKTERARQARWAKKTAPQPDTDAEMPQPSEEEPSTSEATAQDNDGRPLSTPTPVTPLEFDVPPVDIVGTDVPFPSTPADEDQQIQPMPTTSTARCDLLATPSTSKGAGGFGLDDVHMFDELRRRHVWIEEELQRQRRSNAFLRKQLKARRDRSTSLERSASACRQRKALSDVTNTQQGDSRLSAANDLLITLDSGITFKAREALKRSFAGHGHDIWAPTWAVKRLKRELVEGTNFEWVSEGQTRALVCTDVRAMVEGRLQALAESGRLQLHQQFVSQIVLVLTGDKGGDGVAATTKLGLVIGNVAHPNSPRNLSLLGAYFGNDDRRNLEDRFSSIFTQLNDLRDVSFFIAGRRRTVPVQLLLCADLKFTSALLGHQGSAASFPCPLCTARRKELSNKIVGARPSPPPPENSYIWPPLVNIALEDAMDSASLTQFVRRLMCAKRATTSKDGCERLECDDILGLSSGDIYKILDHPNFASFTAPIPPGPLKFTLIDAMNDLRQIYHLSRAKILHPVDLNSLEHWTKMFYCHWQQLRSIDVDRYPVRPKLHLLTAHVVPFARSHLWWGLISEQGMEHMHRMCNNLVGRYSHLGTQEKVVEKLVKHTTMLNALHDRGVDDKKENDKYPDF
ncbi:hypothetical protein niasHT_032062 [Heterodera trifolii]|uniref:Transposase domain-containing protein n=1 Tax=Heterodera trifolii TaxID=157864 RepID=A0ABD2I5X7_9BILA